VKALLYFWPPTGRSIEKSGHVQLFSQKMVNFGLFFHEKSLVGVGKQIFRPKIKSLASCAFIGTNMYKY
jgi:hypothetical protein